MMNYKMALALPAAGFPQRRGCSGCLAGYAFDYSIDDTPIDKQILTDSDWVSKPTLEEVIEELGELLELKQTFAEGGGTHWWATLVKPDLKEEIVGEEVGKTPLEAVSNLYIKLNK